MSSSPRAPAGQPLLRVEDLTIETAGSQKPVRIVDGVGFELAAAERLALVGESGSGKSMLAMALLQLLPTMRCTGRILLDGEDLITASPRRLRAIRGSRIGIVFQDPMSSLDPVMTIGDQVAEPLLIRGTRHRAAYSRAAEVLDSLGVADAQRRLRAYPHEFSGGMRQRVCLAMALIADPDLLIADEPTTALDVRVQDQVLDLLDEATRERGMAVLFITHDLGIVAGFADRVAVMYSGRFVESAPVDELFANPFHPYTRDLLASVPRINRDTTEDLPTIPGSSPSPADRPSGCAFHPRCPAVLDCCDADTPGLELVRGRAVACHAVVRDREEATS